MSRVKIVNDSLDFQGERGHGATDGGNPVSTGLQARTTNPTAVSDGQRVRGTSDDLGRTLTRPYQVRDLIRTGTATLTGGTVTDLLAGTAGFFNDLKQISFANSSGASAEVAIKDDGTTVRTIEVPANNTLNLVFDPPLPQGATGGDWEVDMEDISGTTISIAAEFFREV